MAPNFLKFEMFENLVFWEMFLRNVLKCLKSLTCFLGKSLKMFEIAFSPKIIFLRKSFELFFQHAGTRYGVNHPRDNTHIIYISCGLASGTHTYIIHNLVFSRADRDDCFFQFASIRTHSH